VRGRLRDRRGARQRLFQRLRPVNEILAVGPGPVEQFIAQPLGEGPVGVGHDDRREAGIGDVGMREAGEETGAQRPPPPVGAAGSAARGADRRDARLQFPVRMVVRALPHDMRQHRRIAPRHDRPYLAAHGPQQDLAGAPGGVVGVDMGIGAIAGDDRRVRDHRVVKVGVHVVGDGDRGPGVDRADAAQQFALAVFEAVGDHRAVQVEHDAVEPALANRLADHAGDVFVGGVLDRAARRRAGGDRQHDFGALAGGEVEIGAEPRFGAAIGGDRILAVERSGTMTEPR
jgi:hypothetical protein